MIKHRLPVARATADALLLALVVALSTALLLTGIAHRVASAAPQHAQRAMGTGLCSPLPLNGHCYAKWGWFASMGSVDVAGAQTVITAESGASMKCYGCSGMGMVSDEMWLADYTSTQCVNAKYGACWVEAGVKTFSKTDTGTCNTTRGEICLFWADSRPGTGGFHIHGIYDLGPWGTDLSDYAFDIQIYNLSNPGSITGNEWTVLVTIYNVNWKNPVTITGTSTDNLMTGHVVEIGCEVSDANASAGKFDFTKNSRENTNRNWIYRTTPGVNDSTSPPPWGNWITYPDTSSTNTGGKFQTNDS